MKVLQINTVCGRGSTGRIAADLAEVLAQHGHESRIAYARYEVPDRCKDIAVRIGTEWDVRLHGVKTRLLDGHGFGSRRATKQFLHWVRDYDPDIIHLHNIHGYYLQVEQLFACLKQLGKPVIWTLHDCWPFTGHCAHFSAVGCGQWKTRCETCPQTKRYPACLGKGRAAENFARKKAAFTGVPNLTIVTPSHWLAGLVKESFLGEYPVRVIPNGIDLQVFHPAKSDVRTRYGLGEGRMYLGVAGVWDDRKGLEDFCRLSRMLSEDETIVLVGLTEEQIGQLPEKIVGIQRTESAEELAALYTAADVFLNPTLEDTFPTVNLEALACGTPVVTYRTGGSPESLDETCGVVTDSTPQALYNAAKQLRIGEEPCLARAANYDKWQRFGEYIKLYLEQYGERT